MTCAHVEVVKKYKQCCGKQVISKVEKSKSEEI